MAQRLDVQYIRLYTNGSAALKLESAVPAEKPKTKKQPRKAQCVKVYVDPVALLSIAVATCMLIMMFVGFVRLHDARQQMKDMETYVQYLEAENIELSNQYKEGYDPDQIRQAALEMNMIPAEEAARVSLYIPEEPAPVEEISLWDRIGTFLTGLFA